MHTIYTEVEVDVNIDDILDEMSGSEKRELCEQLIDEGYGPGEEDEFEANCVTHSDSQLLALINELWQNRHLFDVNAIDEVKKMLRERNIL